MNLNVDAHVGLIIKQRRKILEISQAALGKAVGVSFQQIQKYETGVNRVSAATLWQLARVLRCSTGMFFEGLDTGGQAHAANECPGLGFAGEFLASEGGLELARAFLALSPSHRKALVAAGRALAEASRN